MIFDPLPRCDPDLGPSGAEALATAGFLDADTVLHAFGIEALDHATDQLLMGRIGEQLIGYRDDRHLVTVAGSRSGKGTALLVPNLLHYSGSVVAIDPKGELAAITAKYRHEVLGQRVVVLDPFGVAQVDDAFKGQFNPLDDLYPDDIHMIDDAASIAEALMMGKSQQEAHWDETARAFLKGCILYLVLSRPQEDCHLSALEQLVFQGEPDGILMPATTSQDQHQDLRPITGMDVLLERMAKAGSIEEAGKPGEIIASIGAMMLDMGERERGSVLSTARRQLEFIQTPLMAQHTSNSTMAFEELRDPYRMTVYIVLPEWRIASHARWLRLVILWALQKLQRTPKVPDHPPVLMLLDEFASLGKMTAIERAAGYIAGFGVKLWAVLQDLGQLKEHYKASWETFIGNAGLLTAFANTDLTTLKYLSERLDDVEIIREKISRSQSTQSGRSDQGLGKILGGLSGTKDQGLPLMGPDQVSSGGSAQWSSAPDHQKTRLMTPDEIARYFSRRGPDQDETLLALMAGVSPLRLTKLRYYQDAPFQERADPNPYL